MAKTGRRKPETNLLDVLAAIEQICGDDFCEELHCDTRKLSGRIAVASDKLSIIYRLAHSFNTRHSCYSVHDSWRNELREGEGKEP